MMEIQAPYRVGNIIYVDFERVPAPLRPRATPASVEHNALWEASELAYLNAVRTPKDCQPQFLAAMILAFTKLLHAETDGDRSALLALRLVTVELFLAVIGCGDKLQLRRSYANQSLLNLQSIIDYTAGQLYFIDDGDQFFVVPTSIHLRMAGAHRVLADQESVLDCLASAERSLELLDADRLRWVRERLLEQIGRSAHDLRTR